MKRLMIALFVLLASSTSRADLPYGFCAVESEGETLCTPVFPIPDQASLNLVCDNFARALEAAGFDSYLNADILALNQKHKEVCEWP
jgi:hypothetical protein